MRVSPLGANRSVVAPRHLLLLPMLGFAALTFLTQASRVLNGPFRNYALAGGIALVLVVGLWVWLWRAERQAIPAHDGRLLVGLLALGLLGAVLASVYHLPDSDDYMMTPDAVHFISFPDDPLTTEIHYPVPAGWKINSIVAATSRPWEERLQRPETDYVDVLQLHNPGVAVAAAGFT